MPQILPTFVSQRCLAAMQSSGSSPAGTKLALALVRLSISLTVVSSEPFIPIQKLAQAARADVG